MAEFELFEQALSLDSQNPKARTFYVMMVKQINLLQLDHIVPVQPAQDEAKENEDA